MKLKKLVVCSAAVASLAFGAMESFAADPVRVGAAVYGQRGEFMQLWVNALKQHPAVVDGTVDVTVFDGRYDAAVQDGQVDTMITQQMDAIIFVPIDVQAGATSAEKALDAGIPVVGSNTRVNTDRLTSFVGSDDVKAGTLVAESVLEKIGFKGNVVVIDGPIGQSAQVDRGEGIKSVLDKYPEVKVLEKRTANWSRSEALSLMENWLTAHRTEINGVIAQNDEMALGAIQAILAAGYTTEQIPVAGVDGITDALTAVKNGEMDSVLQDATGQAQGALDIALSRVIGQSYEPRSPIWAKYGDAMPWEGGMNVQYNVPWTPVTVDNVDELLKERRN